jgi:hypothetical protein
MKQGCLPPVRLDKMLAELATNLDLTAALKRAAPNDLLPPREDDKVKGEVGKRFVEYLSKQIEENRYEPDQASFVQVPKPGFTSRPAALLTLTDRVVYEAVVDTFRPRLSKYILSDDVVFWPRESYGKKRWEDFEKSALVVGKPYIVQADISGFYESIDHTQLEDDLVLATGQRDAARSLHQFLSRVMAARRGLPQGLLPSDTLATTYLQPVDAAMLQEGFDYFRHGDDMLVATGTMSRAREAISVIEEALRTRGLLLNASKVSVLTRSQYRGNIKSGEEAIRELRESLFDAAVKKVVADQDELVEVMNKANLDAQWQWNLFYHETVSIEEVIEEIRGQLEPNDVEIAERAFSEAVKRAPGTKNALPRELFHFLITHSLMRLAAARSPVAIPHAASVMARFPEKTEIMCRYLQAIMGTHAAEAVSQIENLIGSSLFTTPWQQAWLFRVLSFGGSDLSEGISARLREVAMNSTTHWLARVEAMKVLAQINKLDREPVSRSLKLAPRPYRCDLLAAAARCVNTTEWARKILEASRLDPVEQVVAAHLLATGIRDTKEAG